MPLTEPQRTSLFAALESRGWQWREQFIYAPHDTMWLSGSQPWVGDLSEFHERMCGRLHRNEQSGWAYPQASDHEHLVADTRSLVEALSDLLSASSA